MIHAGLVGAKEKPFWTFANQADFHSAFYFPKVAARSVDVEFRIEGAEPLYIRNLTVHAHPDAIYREFEHGAVFANPGFESYAFDLAKLLPGKSYRRLRGTEKQDPKTNDGSAVGATLQLPARDGLFLVGVKTGGGVMLNHKESVEQPRRCCWHAKKSRTVISSRCFRSRIFLICLASSEGLGSNIERMLSERELRELEVGSSVTAEPRRRVGEQCIDLDGSEFGHASPYPNSGPRRE
jgi:hypothetical protein